MRETRRHDRPNVSILRQSISIRFVVSLAIVMCLSAQPGPLDHGDWGALQYLVNDWIGQGGGGPGPGAGSFSFQPDLQGKILVRKNHAEYPPAHEDDLSAIGRLLDFIPNESAPRYRFTYTRVALTV